MSVLKFTLGGKQIMTFRASFAEEVIASVGEEVLFFENKGVRKTSSDASQKVPVRSVLVTSP